MTLHNNSSKQQWLEAAKAEAWKKAQKTLKAIETASALSKYQQDPLGFCTDVLGDHFTDDVIKVMESVRDNPVTIARSANDVGKSHAAARICAWFYSVYPDSKVILAAAPPLENLKIILWGEIMAVVRKNSTLFTGHNIRSLRISRTDKVRIGEDESFIQGVAIPTSGPASEREAKFSGKHAPHLLFVVDEGDAVPDEVYRGIESCMSGTHDRLLIMFNPRAQAGPVYLKERDRQANVVELSAFRHPNVYTGKVQIPGAVSRETTLRRINEWTRPLADGEQDEGDCFTVPDFLEGTTAQALDGKMYPILPAGKRKILTPEFSYMVLGQYPTQSAMQLINDTWVEQAVERWRAYVQINGEVPPASERGIMGVDMGEYGVDANAACFRYGPFVASLITWNGLDPDATSVRALRYYQERNINIAMIDAGGVGASVAPSMVRQGRKREVRLEVRAVGVKVGERPSPLIKSDLGEFKLLRDQLWWALREWLRTDPAAMLPPDGFLMEELKAVEYWKGDDGKIRVTRKDDLRKRLRRSTDRADALCLTFSPFERPRWMTLVGDQVVEQEQAWAVAVFDQ